MLKQCKECGKEFEPVLLRTIYCNECRTKRINKRINNTHKRQSKRRQEIIKQLREERIDSHEDND